jgi:hypothetical protein
MRSHLLALTLLVVPTAASAVEYLTEVTSDVHQAEGLTVQQIVERGAQCIKSTSGNAADNVLPAVDGDSAYAVVQTEYTYGILTRGQARSRLAVLARDQRFRVTHTDIEGDQRNPFTGKPMQIHKTPGGGAKQAEAAMVARSEALAACIVKTPEVAGGDW